MAKLFHIQQSEVLTCQTSQLKAPLAAYAQNDGYYIVFSIFFICGFVWVVEANLGVREGLREKRATTTNGVVWKISQE